MMQVAYSAEKSDKAAQKPAAAETPQPAASPQVKTIFSYAKELGLSDNQLQKLKDVVTGFRDKFVSLRQKLSDADKELSDMIKNDASLEQIKAKLQEIAEMQVDLRYSDIETSRKINSLLTADQLKKWRQIQEEAMAKEKAEKEAKDKK